MRRAIYLSVLGWAFSVLALAFTASWRSEWRKAVKTDVEIKLEIISESIANYGGTCPCPYNSDGAGGRCGKRSTYSRSGGASRLCYADDVTSKMINDYRKRTRQ